MIFYRHIICIVALQFVLAGCDITPKTAVKSAFNSISTRLGSLPAGYELQDVTFSSDGHRILYSARLDEKIYLFDGFKKSMPYSSVSEFVFDTYNPGGFAFIEKHADMTYVVVNGVLGPLSNEATDLAFLPGNIVTYGETLVPGKRVLVAGTYRSAPFVMTASKPFLTKDKRIYYTEKTENGGAHLRSCTLQFTDCRNGKDYMNISNIYADSTQSKLVFIAEQKSKQTVVAADMTSSDVQEQEGKQYDEILSAAISVDGRHLSYLARNGSSFMLVKDGVVIPYVGHTHLKDMIIAPNGTTFHIGYDKDKVVALLDGKVSGKPYEEIRMPAFSGDGKHFAYAARQGNKWQLVVDANEGPQYDILITPVFSPDGSRVVCRARNEGQRFIVVAGADAQPLKESSRYEMVWGAHFSPDGKRVGYGVKSGQELWWKVDALD